MAQVEKIQAEIETRSKEDFIRLREWFAQKDWSHWDQQIESDSTAGKLNFLVEEAMEAKF